MAGGAAPSGAVRAAGPPLSKFQEYFAFALVTSLFFLWGFSYSLVDVLNKKVQEAFGISHLQSTMIQVAYFGAYFVYSIPASMFASRFGYRKGILMGLSLYTVGAILFWPAAHYAVFWPFPVCAFVIGCGLATLETMANSYVTVLGSPERAAFRLNFAQSFNGLATFIGPLIASHTFFNICLGAAVFILFCFAKLPEISEDNLEDAQEEVGVADNRPLWKRKHTMFGFLCQFCYVGAQVSVASFVVNYLTDDKQYTNAQASQFFSYMQITFMVTRFAVTPLTRIVPAGLLVAAFGTLCTAFALMAALTGDKPGLAALFIIFVGESLIYPTVFTLATSNLGKLTKRGAGLLVAGVAGGAVFPPMQGALSDAKGSTISYLIPMAGFSIIVPYGLAMHVYQRRFARLVAANAGLEGGLQRTESFDKSKKEEVEEVERA
ncbi:hypothetical protein JCM10213_004897 [Rhodosporidiobolus nylandii]